MNIQETITSRQNLLKELRITHFSNSYNESLWTRVLPIEVVEEWHNYCQDDEDLSDVDEDLALQI